MDTNLLLLTVTALGNILALIRCLRLQREVAETSGVIHRSAVHQRELAQLLENHTQLANLQNLTETAIDSGTSTIRSLHREIANIPFEILQDLPATRDTTHIVRGVHDLTAEGVYTSIVKINRLMGEQLRRQFKLRGLETSDDQAPE